MPTDTRPTPYEDTALSKLLTTYLKGVSLTAKTAVLPAELENTAVRIEDLVDEAPQLTLSESGLLLPFLADRLDRQFYQAIAAISQAEWYGPDASQRQEEVRRLMLWSARYCRSLTLTRKHAPDYTFLVIGSFKASEAGDYLLQQVHDLGQENGLLTVE